MYDITIVSTIKSANIRRITFTEFSPVNDYKLYWEKLDRTLCNLVGEKGPATELDVEVQMSPHFEQCDKLEQNLPEFEKVGRVTFVDGTGKVVYSAGKQRATG